MVTCKGARPQEVYSSGSAPKLLLWAVIVPMVMLSDRPHSFSVRETLPLAIFMLPIFLLGGYLSGRWKWKDFEKKFPE